MFAEDGGPSLTEKFMRRGLSVLPADNTRVGKVGAASGWDSIQTRLLGDEDGKPMLLIFSTCTNLIRTLPLMVHDPARAEDLDSSGEDHACDALRYGCLWRSWVKTEPRPQVQSDRWRSDGGRR
jgi:hypothetical protein